MFSTATESTQTPQPRLEPEPWPCARTAGALESNRKVRKARDFPNFSVRLHVAWERGRTGHGLKSDLWCRCVAVALCRGPLCFTALGSAAVSLCRFVIVSLCRCVAVSLRSLCAAAATPNASLRRRVADVPLTFPLSQGPWSSAMWWGVRPDLGAEHF